LKDEPNKPPRWHYFPAEDQLKRARSAYVDYFTPGGEVLDFGCGRGEFLELLRASKRRGYGVEYDTDLVDICLRKGLHVIQGDVLDFFERNPTRRWDGIFMGHLIEHFDSATALRLLQLASTRLKPGGRIVILTPNPNFLPGVGDFWSDMTHCRPYPMNGLKDAFTRLGLRLVAHGTDPHSRLRVTWHRPLEAVVNSVRLFLLRLIMLEYYDGGEIFLVGEK
jgi:SAM-dependent methyltransferase